MTDDTTNFYRSKLFQALHLLDLADCPECKTKSGAYYNMLGNLKQCKWCEGVSKLKKEVGL